MTVDVERLNDLAPDKWKNWCRRLTTDVTPQGKIGRLEIVHDNGEPSSTDRIAVYAITDETDPDELAEDAWGRADDDAATRANNSQQRYGGFAYYLNATEHSYMYSWLVRGRGPSAVAGPFGGDGMDPPDARGLTQVALRAMSESVRQVMQMTESQAGSLAAELERERSLRRAAESAQLDLMVIQQGLLDTSADRALKIEREARRAARVDKIVEGLAPLLPLLVGELVASRGLARTGKSGRDAAVALFFSSLTEEQFTAIAANLSPEQNLTILELFKSYARDSRAHDEATTKVKAEMTEATNVTLIRPTPAKDAR